MSDFLAMLTATHQRMQMLAARSYLRCGFVPDELARMVAGTASLEAFLKYRPDQPRAPAGRPDGGQWVREPDGRLVPVAQPTANPVSPLIDVVIDDPPLEPVYPLEMLLLPALPFGSRLLALWRIYADLRRVDPQKTTWSLGHHKSATRWANQIKNRNWTPEEITATLANGKRFPAPNMVRPANGATRYQNFRTGRFVVRDDVTGEILQISGDPKKFEPMEFSDSSKYRFNKPLAQSRMMPCKQ